MNRTGMNRYRYNEAEDAEYYNPGYSMPYTRSESNVLVIVSIFVVLALIIVAIILALYFTCTTPFDGSDSCKCTKSKGTYKDGKCTCPTSLKLIGGQCVEPLSQFTKLPNQAISGYNKENYQATTPEACALLCLDRSWCNSIDYNHDDKSCFLQDNPPATATYSTTIWDNYKRK